MKVGDEITVKLDYETIATVIEIKRDTLIVEWEDDNCVLQRKEVAK